MKRYLIYPCKAGWGLRKAGGAKALGLYKLRRDALSAAKVLVGKHDVITVHNTVGQVVIRIPELSTEKAAAAVYIKRAAAMTPGGRRRVAAWLIRQAEMLVQEGKNYADSFRGRYLYNTRESV